MCSLAFGRGLLFNIVSHKPLKRMVDNKADNENPVERDKPDFAVEPKLFGNWSYEGVECSDMSLAAYLQVKSVK